MIGSKWTFLGCSDHWLPTNSMFCHIHLAVCLVEPYQTASEISTISSMLPLMSEWGRDKLRDRIATKKFHFSAHRAQMTFPQQKVPYFLSLILSDSLWLSLAHSWSLSLANSRTFWLTLTESGSLWFTLALSLALSRAHRLTGSFTTLWLRGRSLSRPSLDFHNDTLPVLKWGPVCHKKGLHVTRWDNDSTRAWWKSGWFLAEKENQQA